MRQLPATRGGAASFPVPPETITLSQRTFGASGTVPGSGITVSYSAFYRSRGVLPAVHVPRSEQRPQHVVIVACARCHDRARGVTPRRP